MKKKKRKKDHESNIEKKKNDHEKRIEEEE